MYRSHVQVPSRVRLEYAHGVPGALTCQRAHEAGMRGSVKCGLPCFSGYQGCVPGCAVLAVENRATPA